MRSWDSRAPARRVALSLAAVARPEAGRCIIAAPGLGRGRRAGGDPKPTT